MPRIIWKGCSRKPYEAPDEPLLPEAIKVEIPRNHFWMRALFMAAPLFLPVVASLYLKSHIAGYALIDKRWIALGLLGALLLSIVHEWLHCLPYPPYGFRLHRHSSRTVYGIHDLQLSYQPQKRYDFFIASCPFRGHPMDCISVLPRHSKGVRVFLLGTCHYGSYIPLPGLSSCVLYMEMRSGARFRPDYKSWDLLV